jgi:hypothetical protein
MGRGGGARVAEVLLEYPDAVTSDAGTNYIARAVGSEAPGGTWQGWIEFVPIGSGDPVRTSRETTQPNRQDTKYWATGLTPIYLQGALRRALVRPVRPVVAPRPDPIFDAPAEAFAETTGNHEAVMDPFSVHRKGEALLRRQLSALAGWHLVNIIRKFKLSDESDAYLSSRQPAELVELIIREVARQQPATR